MTTMSADEWNTSRAKANQGRSGQLAGKGFEGDLEYTHDRYRAEGRADIFKLPVATQPMPRSWLSDPKRFGPARILAERQRADYFGTLGGGLGKSPFYGRAVAMEAKYSTERLASLPILRENQKGSGLKVHQLEHLARGWHDFGTLSVVVWRNGHERLVFCPDLLAWAFNAFRLQKINRIYPVDARAYTTGGKLGITEEDWLTTAEEWLRGAAGIGFPPLADRVTSD